MNFTSKFIETALALSFSKVEEVKNNRIKELLEIKLKTDIVIEGYGFLLIN